MDKTERLKKELKEVRDGFTLIEMLVVIAVIGILASVIVVGLGGAREGSRDARRVADIRQIQNALELRYSDADGYPAAVTCDGTDGVSEAGDGNAPCFTGPQGETYMYEAVTGGPAGLNTNYRLGACLEGEDNDNTGLDPANDDACPGVMDCSATAPNAAFCASTL